MRLCTSTPAVPRIFVSIFGGGVRGLRTFNFRRRSLTYPYRSLLLRLLVMLPHLSLCLVAGAHFLDIVFIKDAHLPKEQAGPKGRSEGQVE